MKKLIFFLAIFISILGNAQNTYYVSTTGNNSNPGSKAYPWLTIQYGVTHIAAGDTLYVRGGTYSPTATTAHSMYCGVLVDGVLGNSGAKYNVYNYPGETPIIDGGNITGTTYPKTGIYIYSAAYWHFKGFIVRNFVQASNGREGEGIFMQGGNHVVIENCEVYSCGGPGFQTRTPNGDGHTFLNCDAHDNYDQYTTDPVGGDADGFDIGFGYNNYKQYMLYCRSWNNSDDGIDLYQYPGYESIYYIIGCWAWHNGYRSDQVTTAGDGCGYKLGADNLNSYSVVRRFVYSCIAYDNRTRGFSQESAQVLKVLYNNFAYGNESHGFSFYNLDVHDTLRNNISFGNSGDAVEHLGTNRVSDHNTWDASTGVTVTSADFVSLTGSQLAGSRQSDGSLPVITFGHLSSTSDLIGAGIRQPGVVTDGDGNAYNNPPSLGPFEYNIPVAATVPVVSTTAITGISGVSAYSGGTVTDDGNASVTARGVCWGASANPTVSGSHTTNGTGTGSFISIITGLSKNSTYHVRAYATNSEGTSYGADIQFTTTNYQIVVY